MIGTFFKAIDAAGAYRGKQLGFCAIHHLIAALCLFYNIENWHTIVYCNNHCAIIKCLKEFCKEFNRGQGEETSCSLVDMQLCL